MSRVPVLKPFMTRRFLALSFFRFFSTIASPKQDLRDAGRVIVRYSGTENKLRILAEARTESAARLWHDKIAGVAARELEVIP